MVFFLESDGSAAAEDEGFDYITVSPPSRPAASKAPPEPCSQIGSNPSTDGKKKNTISYSTTTQMTLCLHPFGRIHKVMDSPTG